MLLCGERHAQDIIRYDMMTLSGFFLAIGVFKRSCIEGASIFDGGVFTSWIYIMEEAFGLILSVFARSIILSREFPD